MKTKFLSIILGAIIGLSLTYGAVAFSQSSLWYPSSGNLKPVVSSWGIQMPSFTNCDTIDTDGSGVFSCGTDATGAAGLFSTSTGFTYLTDTTSDLINRLKAKGVDWGNTQSALRAYADFSKTFNQRRRFPHRQPCSFSLDG